jgi:hypothetical protein
MEIQTHTISEKYDSFIWLPPKCATHLLSWVFTYFEFSSIALDKETNKILHVALNQITHLGHNTSFPPNYSDLSFICATRNPYERALSFYQFSGLHNQKSLSGFENFIRERLSKDLFFNYTDLFKVKKPDYIIRTENLYEDLIKIPFIKDSDLRHFYKVKMHEDIKNYAPGDPSMKPDVIQTIEEKKKANEFAIQYGNIRLVGNDILNQLNQQKLYINLLQDKIVKLEQELKSKS